MNSTAVGITAFGLGVAIGVVAGYTGHDLVDRQPAVDQLVAHVELLDARKIWYAPTDCISGVVTNRGPAAAPVVTIEFNLYDATGSQIANAQDTIKNLAPSSTWCFRIPVDVQFSRFALTSLDVSY